MGLGIEYGKSSSGVKHFMEVTAAQQGHKRKQEKKLFKCGALGYC